MRKNFNFLSCFEFAFDLITSTRYEEVTLFSKDHVKPFKFSSPTGHYTALAWAETDKVELW